MRLRYTRLALADLQCAFDYVFERNPDAARDMVDAIESGLQTLLTHPKLGRAGRVSGTRELVITGTPFIAAYRVDMATIDVLAVIHDARRWPTAFE